MSVKKNYLYTLFYQLLTIALPLITIPYISRVLGAEGVGIYAYTTSIIQYFILLGTLGIFTYGSKNIATVRDNKEELSIEFLSIYGLQVIMSLLSVGMYLLLVFFGTFEYKGIMYIQIITLISCLFDCSWFFSGLEKFKQIVIRNSLVKVFSLFLLFLLVKTAEDLPMYTVIMTGSTLIGQLILWFGIKEEIKFIPINFKQIQQHFKPTLVYFIPQIALQVYFVLNKTLIGVLSTKAEVGIFDYADKLLRVCLAFVTSLGTIMLPKMSYIFSRGDMLKIREYLFKSLDFSTLIAVPIMLGLAGISFEMIPWYLGEEFIKSIDVLVIICPTIIFMAWTGVFGSQYLVPLGKMTVYTCSIYAGATVNLILNMILIKKYGAIGASFGTLFAELAVLIVQLIAVRGQIDFKKIGWKTIDYLIAGIMMLLVVRFIGNYFGAEILTTLLQIIVGAFVYLSLIVLIEMYREEGFVTVELRNILRLLQR